MRRHIYALYLLLASCLCPGQAALTRGEYNADLSVKNIAQAGTGTYTRSALLKQRFAYGQIPWTTPVKVIIGGTNGTFSPGETVTQSTTYATGILTLKTSVALWIYPLTGTFTSTSANTITGGTSGASTTSIGAVTLPTTYVWGSYKNHTGILAFNGTTTRRGGATASPSYNTEPPLYGTGSGIYTTNYATEAIVPYTTETSGPFTLGEIVTQATTTATGKIWKDTGSAIYIEVTSGTFDGTGAHTVAGATASIAPTGITNNASTWFIEWSPDGFTDFVPTTDLPTNELTSQLPSQIIDCGIIAGSVNGHTNSRIVLYVQYCEGNPQVCYSQPDYNPYLWTSIITASGSGTGAWPTSTQAIRHFHGAQWVPGIGAKEGRLFVMCGDTDFQCGILTCDDIASLCNSGSTWKTYWGLDRCGPSRAFWFSAPTTSTDTVPVAASNLTAGEKVTQGSAVGYVVTDTAGTLTINRATGSTAFANGGGSILGATSAATDTPNGSVTTTSTGGGANYACGTNPYPLAANALCTGQQGVGGQDCRTVQIVVDGRVQATYSSETKAFIPTEYVTQATSKAFGKAISDGGNVLSIQPGLNSPKFDGSHSITGNVSGAVATVTSQEVGQYGYMIPDQAAAYSASGTLPANDGYALPNGANFPRRINLVTKSITTFGTRAVGTGWSGALTPDGTVIVSTQPDHTASDGTAYTGNADGYVHYYAVGPDLNSIYDVQDFPRADFANPGNSAVYVSPFVAFGALWGWDCGGGWATTGVVDGSPIGTFSNKPGLPVDLVSNGIANQQQTPVWNMIEGGRFFESTDPAKWSYSNVGGWAVSTTYIDSDWGSSQSVRLNAGASNANSYVSYSFDQRSVYSMRGQLVTFRIRIYVPTSTPGTTVPQIQVVLGSGDSIATTITPYDGFQTITLPPIYVSASETAVTAYIYNKQTGTDTATHYISEADFVLGCQVPPGAIQPRNLAMQLSDFQRGRYSFAVAGNVTLTSYYAKYRTLVMTGTPGATYTTTVPSVTSAGTASATTDPGMSYDVWNNTDTAQVFKVASQIGVTIGAGAWAHVVVDASDIARTGPDTFANGPAFTPLIVTSAGNITGALTDAFVLVNKASGAATSYTPTTVPRGWKVTIKDGKGDASTNNITFVGTVDGSTNYVINTNYGSATFVWNGTQWNKL